MKDIVLFGAGGLGREAAMMIEYSINAVHPNTYRHIGYIVDEKYAKPGTNINGLPVLGGMDWLVKHKDDVVCALTIAENHVEKEKVFHRLDEQGVRIESLIAANTFVPPTCKIGRGCYIAEGCLLSVNSEIGDGVFINSRCLCGHDVSIGEFSVLFPRVTVSGRCKIGKHVLIGGASYIVPDRKIGDGAVVAAGSVVFTNVRAGTKVLGNPARRMKELE